MKNTIILISLPHLSLTSVQMQLRGSKLTLGFFVNRRKAFSHPAWAFCCAWSGTAIEGVSSAGRSVKAAGTQPGGFAWSCTHFHGQGCGLMSVQ